MRNNKIQQKKWYERLVSEDSDVALVRVFECFLEAAPQKILQISIILSGEESATGEHKFMPKFQKALIQFRCVFYFNFSSTIVELVQFNV